MLPKCVYSNQMMCFYVQAYPATTGPEHGQINRYVNHHANRVSLIALLFLFFSSVQTIVFQPLQVLDGRNSGIFVCSNDLVELLCSKRAVDVKT